MNVVLPSGLMVNLTNVTHTRPAHWLVWPSAQEPKVEHTGLDVHFIGGSVVRVEQPDADALHYLLIQAA